MKKKFIIEVGYKENEIEGLDAIKDTSKLIMKKLSKMDGVYSVSVEIESTEEIIIKTLERKKQEKELPNE